MLPHHDVSELGRSILITPPDPDVAAVTLDEAKIGLGITSTSQDDIVAAAIAAAADALDPASGGWLGRALRPQTWELQLRAFGSHRAHWHHTCANAILLPYPPLISVDSVKYLDSAGVDQTLALTTGYRVLGKGQVYGRAYIAPPYAGAWPVARFDDASIRIRFTAGYADDSDPASAMPRSLKHAIILGARALMSVTSRDMLLFEDRVEGMGSKRYQNNPAVAEIVNKAIASLLSNLSI
jgi:uncharacterized phiE125 gp8 family phage protein